MPTYYIDPAVAGDANNGSSWALAFKTLKHTFAAGDVINLAKSVETALAGTVTATKGSVTVNTTSDLTGVLAQYSFIRINNDPTIYMVNARTSSTITLYRPFRGDGGAGLGITSLAALVIASGDFTPTAGNGAVGNLITLRAGINTSNDAQDGFTVLNANNASYGWSTGTRSFWNISNLGFYYATNPWGNSANSDCIFTKCFSFRGTYFCNGYNFTRCLWTTLVCEASPFNQLGLYSCTINGIETANPGSLGISTYSGAAFRDTIISNWKNAGYAGQYAFSLVAPYSNVRFIDAVLDELGSGCTMLRMASAGGTASGLVFQNPIIGAGTLIDVSSYYYQGEISFSTVNGDYTDNRRYICFGDTAKYYLLAYDAVTYHTGNAAKITAVGPPTHPITIRHYIPCDAGVTKTVSVWLRKSSSPAYGSSNLPFMRLRWMTGTGASMVSNIYDVAMTDTNDSFVQVSHEVTPSVNGVIIMELIFQAGANNALAWYDDIGVA